MSPAAAQSPLRHDPRTAEVAAVEPVTLPPHRAEELLATLRAGEKVLALYHQGLGYAALTDDALILLGGETPTRVERPLTILRPAYGARQRVDVSVKGRRVAVWGSRIDASGGLVQRAGNPATGSLAGDPRTAVVAADETLSLSDDHRNVLLGELEPGEDVRALYHCGWGYAALTRNGLVLLRGLVAPKAVRAPKPLRILRRTYGILNSVDLLIDGKPYKLHGSKIDPKGDRLQRMGDLLPADSPLRPHGRARFLTWIRRHPVLMSLAVVGALFAGSGAVSGGGHATARGGTDSVLDVPDFKGAELTAAVADARRHPWVSVSAVDASSDLRRVDLTTSGWRVCFQTPSRDESVRPSRRFLTLYAVPEQELCPTQLLGPRRIVMPDLIGRRFDDALRVLGDLDVAHTATWHAHTNRRLYDDRDLDDWRVCRQQPEPESEVSAWTQVDLWLIDPDTPCAQPSPSPKPKPKPKPKPNPNPEPESRPRPQPQYGSTASGGTTGGSTGGGSSRSGSSTSGGSSTTSGGTSGGSSSTSGGTTGGTGSRPGTQFGQYCSPVGATATTTDGRPAKCFMGRDGQARWGYNSG
ncbi:hypothetical protein [Streptomyces sp. NPDC048242]|uniref:hypothetical protein n=1 Tax=Streptomyces sp. NPDC048242 TaxID=3155026 RepID=UPI00342D68CE